MNNEGEFVYSHEEILTSLLDQHFSGHLPVCGGDLSSLAPARADNSSVTLIDRIITTQSEGCAIFYVNSKQIIRT